MDLTDPMVRAMADRNHVPDEITRRTASGVAYTEVVCEQCGAAWPCETRRKLRQIEAKEDR
jgi:hypothetical protein